MTASEHYQRAVLLLDDYRNAARGGRRLLQQAREHLEAALELRPAHAKSQAALGYTFDQLGRRYAERALACMREARRLKPGERIYDVYVPTLLFSMDREKEAIAEIKAVARRQKVDLAAIDRGFKEAGWPKPKSLDYLMNGFIRARNFLVSGIADEAERLRGKFDPGPGCREHQKALQANFDASRVPKPLRRLAGWAARYGIGDDYCRPYLMKRLRKKQKAKLIREVDALSKEIDAWLDTFPEGKMTDEAAAFMYLALGVEEMR